MRQSITLTGCGSDIFDDCVEGIQAIHGILKRSHEQSTVDDWGPGRYQEHIAIDMGNRFFTDRHDRGQNETIDFPTSVDPNGVLTQSMGGDFVHLEENEVKYYEIAKIGEETTRYAVTEEFKGYPLNIYIADIKKSIQSKYKQAILWKCKYHFPPFPSKEIGIRCYLFLDP
jgi:hypothetical protein